MSVYTELHSEDFRHILSNYDLGRLTHFQGIAAGIENTNYKITLNKGDESHEYFLTLFENLNQSELGYFIPLLHHLDVNCCKVAGPISQINGDFVFTIHNKAAAIFECLQGGHVNTISEQHCHIIGAELARIHMAAKTFPQQHDNPRGFYWLQKQIQNNQLTINTEDQRLLQQYLDECQQHWKSWQSMDLPKGFIHGDLFPDNCLFNPDDSLSGVIDFYAGGQDFWVYDLAILMMAWGQDGKQFDGKLKQAVLSGYEEIRALTENEREALPHFIKLACLRFWVSRLIAQQEQKGASLTTEKEPDEMKALLLSL